MKEYLQIISTQYDSYEGQMQRGEFWRFILFQTLGFVLTISTDLLIVFTTRSGQWAFLSLIFFLATLLPGICAVIRRLHDTGRKGWHLLTLLVPVLGLIYLLIILLQRGKTAQ